MAVTGKAKDILHLMRNIASFSDGQATVQDCESCDAVLTVRIVPNDGLYRGGTFDFRLDFSWYPSCAPSVTCLTKIYHPNIDYYSSEDNICLNLIDDDWTSTSTLEDVVQGLLFLLYNPNLDDALSPWFGATTDYEEFADNVAKSLRGEVVEDINFDKNCLHDIDPEKDLLPDEIVDVIMEDMFTSFTYINPGEKYSDVTEMNLRNLESTVKAETTVSGEITLDANIMSWETNLIKTQLIDTTELPTLERLENSSTNEEGKTTEKTSQSDSLNLMNGNLEVCEKNVHLSHSKRHLTFLYCDNLAPEINLMSALLPNVVKYIFRSVNLRSKKSNHFS